MINTATQTPTEQVSGQMLSMPRIMLHIEGIALLIGAIVVYSQQSGDWRAFLILLLTPDLVFIPYMMNQRIGTIAYNVMHTTTLPIILVLFALAAGWDTGISLAIIWFAHIGMDRTLGYGLKYMSDFKDTHIRRS